MKFKNCVVLLTVGSVLSLGAVGCKKRPEGVTPLPGRGAPGSFTDTGGPIDDGGIGGIGSEGLGSEGVAQPTSFIGWPEDRLMFEGQTVYFDLDKAVVRASELPKLELVASRMQSLRGKGLRIEGHCDERGTEEYNRSLGERRALAVREALVRLGMDPGWTETISFGEDRPADPGRSQAAWAKNRRGQLILMSPPGGG